MNAAIRIWPYSNAPQKYRQSYGGDEDWVVFVPDELMDKIVLPLYIDVSPGERYWCPLLGWYSAPKKIRGGWAFTFRHS